MNQEINSKKHKQERIPCPYCKELIMPGAIKCRFCGEKISTKLQNVKRKKPLFSTKVLYLIWLLCLIVFLSTIFFEKKYASSFNILMFLAILVGGIVFLELFFRVIRPKRFNNGKYGLITFLTFIAFFGILLNQEKIQILLGLSSALEINQPTINESSDITPPTPIPTKSVNKINKEVNTVPKTNTNLIDCTGPDGKVFKTTQQECDDFNAAWNNPPTDKKEENETDFISCNLSYGTYFIHYEDCYYYQSLENNNNQNNYQPPTTVNYVSPIQQVPETPPDVNNAELRSACITEASRIYNQELTSAGSRARALGISGSTYESMLTKLENDYNSAVYECETLYPSQ